MSTQEQINRPMTIADWVVAQGFEYRAEYLRDHIKWDNTAYFWVTIKYQGKAVAFEQMWEAENVENKRKPPRMLQLFSLYQELGEIDRVFGYNTEPLNLFILAQLGQEKYQQFLNCKG